MTSSCYIFHPNVNLNTKSLTPTSWSTSTIFLMRNHSREFSRDRGLSCLSSFTVRKHLLSIPLLLIQYGGELGVCVKQNRFSAFSLSTFTYLIAHDDVIKWKHFPRYWSSVRWIRRSPVNSPHKGGPTTDDDSRQIMNHVWSYHYKL